MRFEQPCERVLGDRLPALAPFGPGANGNRQLLVALLNGNRQLLVALLPLRAMQDLHADKRDKRDIVPPCSFGISPSMCSYGTTADGTTDAIIALALGATSVGIGRPYSYALSYGGAESLTHYLRSFLAELDLCLAICGFKDIATLKQAGCEEALTFQSCQRSTEIRNIGSDS